METQLPYTIELKLSPKGRYYWAIQASSATKDSIVDEIAELNTKLKDTFPQNASELPTTGRSKFTEVEDF